jgi:hypothetical protein
VVHKEFVPEVKTVKIEFWVQVLEKVIGADLEYDRSFK